MTTSENEASLVARQGAVSPIDVPADVLAQLSDGTLATTTLAEGLALDFALLMQNVAPGVGTEAIAE